MIDVFGAVFLMIFSREDVEIVEMKNFESCRAAVVQMEPILYGKAICVASDVTTKLEADQ